jgi:hypothetical protein
METARTRSTLLSRRGRGLVLGAAAFFALVAAADAQARDIQDVSVLGIKNALLEKAATGAVTLALQKLSQPRCQQIFTDFHDTTGAPLQSHLDALGYSGSNFLETLRFANGERTEPCQSTRVLAATAPNSHVIFLCGIQFFQRQRASPEFSAALVIHEMLHSLGLGENPPSSNEITMRVLARCGT